MNKNIKKILNCFYIFLIFSILPAYASETEGTIDSGNHSALLCLNDDCSSSSRINFLTTNGEAVLITDTQLTGEIWGENIGWINLSPAISGVTNTEDGTLGGYAWGENTGWINFAPTNGGVTIDAQGHFVGWAWSQNYGWIEFNCSVLNACVETDWRPLSERDSGGTTGGYGGNNNVQPPLNPEPPIITPEIIEPVIDNENKVPEENIDTEREPENEIVETINEEEENNDGEETGVVDNLDNFISNILSGSSSNVKKEDKVEFREKVMTSSVEIIEDVLMIAKESLDEREEKAVAEAVTVTGVATGIYLGAVNVAFTSPITFSELPFLFMRIWSLILAFFGIKKKCSAWGTVYDSVTKQPLDPAYVVLQDLQGKEVATSITDLDGRYGFLVGPGKYKIFAKKTNYEFPSKKLFGKQNDELYQDLYFNEIIEVKEGGEVISKSIPLDPINFDWNEFAKKEHGLTRFYNRKDLWIARISNFLFFVGFVIALSSVYVSPILYNKIILAVYVLLFVLRKTIFKSKAFGKVKVILTDNPLPFAIMRFFYSGTNNEATHKVTDRGGKYYCLIPNGVYYVKIENKNYDGTYTLAHVSTPLEVKKGYINKKFEI